MDLTQKDGTSFASFSVSCPSLSSAVIANNALLSSSIQRSSISAPFLSIPPWSSLIEGLSSFSMVLGDAVLTYCDQYDLFIQQYDSMQCTTACPARDVTIISMFLSGIQPTSALSSYDFSGYDDWHQFVTFLRSLVFRCSREGTSFLYADFFRLPTAPRSCAQSLNPIIICNIKPNQRIAVPSLTSRTVIVDSSAGVTTAPSPAYNS